MMPCLAALLWIAVALASLAEAGDPVVVVQETRTPVVSKKHRTVQHVVLLKNVFPYPVRGLLVTVEFYDFFGKLLLVRTGTPVPTSLGPGDTATLSLSTPPSKPPERPATASSTREALRATPGRDPGEAGVTQRGGDDPSRSSPLPPKAPFSFASPCGTPVAPSRWRRDPATTGPRGGTHEDREDSRSAGRVGAG